MEHEPGFAFVEFIHKIFYLSSSFCALSVAQCIVEAFLSVVSYYVVQAGLELCNLISPAHLRIQGPVSSAGLNAKRLKRELEESQLDGVPRAQGGRKVWLKWTQVKG